MNWYPWTSKNKAITSKLRISIQMCKSMLLVGNAESVLFSHLSDK